VTTPTGLRIEVKCSGRIQTWKQTGLSTIRFDIAEKLPWDAQTNTLGTVRCRPASVYVFAIHKHEDRATADPLDVAQWEFLVLPARALPAQKSIGLVSLLKLNPVSAGFEGLARAAELAGAR
jgi:hypothetical protein